MIFFLDVYDNENNHLIAISEYVKYAIRPTLHQVPSMPSMIPNMKTDFSATISEHYFSLFRRRFIDILSTIFFEYIDVD